MTDGKKKNNGRVLASMSMLVTFIMLIPSGIMMHMYDTPGDISIRHFAMGMHNICATAFVIAGLYHIKYNFRAILKYMSTYARELTITAAFTAIMLLFSVIHAFH